VLALAGRVLAGKWSIPAIQTSPMFALDLEHLENQIPDAQFRKQELEFSRAAHLFVEQHGVVSNNAGFHEEKLNIHLFPKALQLPGNVFGSKYFYAGRCAAEQPCYGDWKNCSPDMPIVLVSNSTTYFRGSDFFRMCIEALSGLGWHVILSIGEQVDPESLGRLPPHVEVVQKTSNVRILPHLSLFICPGGIITQAEAAYHGVPLIAASQGFRELEWVSENIPRTGIGLHIKQADMSVAALREAAIHVFNDRSISDSVRRLRSTVRRDAGGEETVNRIEEYLESEV
jgi:MGT family glycosyltransferase